MRVILIIAFILLFQLEAFAWNDEFTHRTLSEKAAELHWGPAFLDDMLFGQKIRNIIKEGAEREDDYSLWDIFNPRSRNHFYAPNRQDLNKTGWEGQKLTDGLPTPIWAQNGDFQKNKEGGDWSWQKVQKDYFNYLTASEKTARDTNQVAYLKGVGYQMHLIQDMSQPNHVRDDTHLADGFGWTLIVNGLETWAKNNDKKIIQGQILNKLNEKGSPAFPIPTVQVDLKQLFNEDEDLSPVARLFDTRGYAQNLTPSTSLAQGLAEYTNANFFSENTAFAAERYDSSNTLKYFPYPRKEETSLQEFIDEYLDPSPETDADGKSYLVDKISKQNTEGEKLNCLAVPGPATLSYFKEFGGESSMFYRSFGLSAEVCLQEYAEKLIPMAVGYSKAMLEYFHRGKLKVDLQPGYLTFGSVKVGIASDTLGEALGTGELAVVFRYKNMTESGMGNGIYLVDYPVENYSYKVVTIPEADLADSPTQSFDFGGSPLPLNFSDMSMQVVYKGKLGNEPEAVAISPWLQIDGIYSDLDISLPASGVYAKASDNTPEATFGELRLNVLTHNTGGLSGGTFQLALQYRVATSDQFQSIPVTTEPANETGYLYRASAKNGINYLASEVPAELVFELPQLPVQATDVEINLIYTSPDGKQTIGYHDISEPTPIDIYNNTDMVCVNGLWEPAGTFETIDIYPHIITNIFNRLSLAGSGELVDSNNFTFHSSERLVGGMQRRLGFVLTDYTFDLSYQADWSNDDPNNPIITRTYFWKDRAAVKHQTEADGTYIYPGMNSIGSKLIWGGVVFAHSLDEDAVCGWKNLPGT